MVRRRGERPSKALGSNATHQPGAAVKPWLQHSSGSPLPQWLLPVCTSRLKDGDRPRLPTAPAPGAAGLGRAVGLSASAYSAGLRKPRDGRPRVARAALTSATMPAATGAEADVPSSGKNDALMAVR